MPIIQIESFGGGVGQTAAQNSQALNNAINALPNGGTIQFATPNGVYKFAVSATPISKNNIKLLGNTQAILQWDILGAAKNGIEVIANGFSCENITFRGPGSALTYIADETLVRVRGTSASSRILGLTLKNCRFEKCGSYGLFSKWVDDIVVDGIEAREIAYGAVVFVSCNNGRVVGGKIDVLSAIGTTGNAYGISLTHDNTNYSTDPFAGTPQAANPFCNNWIIDGLSVIGPRIWQAIDTHGCYNTSIHNCRTYGAALGISVTGGSGAAANYAGWNNCCINCVVDIRLPDGLSSGATPLTGITIQGGSQVAHTGLICSGNRVHGYGNSNAQGAYTSYAINASAYVDKFVVSQNIFTDWGGCAIFCQTGTTDGAIIDNVFGEPKSSLVSECINVTGASATRLRIGGNVAEKGQTRQPTMGIRFTQIVGSRILIDGNMFDLCTIDYLNAEGIAHGPGFPGVIRLTNTSGAVTVDCGLARIAPGIPITIVFSGLTGNITSVNLANAPAGGSVIINNEDPTNSVTIVSSGSLHGSTASWVGNQWDTLTLLARPPGGFVELARSSNI